MSDWPFVEGARLVSVAHVATSEGTDVIDALNSKPATPTQLIAATAFDACGVLVTVTGGTTLTTQLVDIMAGGVGAEFVLIPDLLASAATGTSMGASYFFPIFVAKGTRLSARASASTVGTCRINVHLLQGSYGATSFSKVTAYGAVLASSMGTVIDPGAVANTRPALPATQLVAATSDPIRLLTIAVGNAGTYVRTPAGGSLLDLYAGAGSGEYAVVDNIFVNFDTSKDNWAPVVPVSNVPVYIPKGTRLSARAASNATAAGVRQLDMIVYGVS